ncbi:MAG: hypothetical protein IPL62_17115 [Caulobacteraceae bacterium]|nr:hypothetical protein [Caulobacteraceae bacterium]
MKAFVRRTFRTTAVATALLASIVTQSSVAGAQTQQSATASALVARCEALRTTDFSQVPDAPTRIHSARLVEATPSQPAFCEITGNIAPQVGILMRLPAEI